MHIFKRSNLFVKKIRWLDVIHDVSNVLRFYSVQTNFMAFGIAVNVNIGLERQFVKCAMPINKIRGTYIKADGESITSATCRMWSSDLIISSLYIVKYVSSSCLWFWYWTKCKFKLNLEDRTLITTLVGIVI